MWRACWHGLDGGHAGMVDIFGMVGTLGSVRNLNLRISIYTFYSESQLRACNKNLYWRLLSKVSIQLEFTVSV